MAGRTHGRNGSIYIDISSAANGTATPVSYLNSWSLDQSTDTVDVTSFADTTKTYVAGLPDATGQMSGFVNMGTTAFTTLADGSARKLYLYPDRSGNVSTYFFCTAVFSASFEGSSGDAIKCSINWNAATSGSWVSGF